MSVDKDAGIMATDVRCTVWSVEWCIMGPGSGSQHGPSPQIISFLCYCRRSWW